MAKMKYIPLAAGIALSILLASCQYTRIRERYSGFVMDQDGLPVAGVVVREDLRQGVSARTDSAGYFSIKRTGDSLPDLILTKNGYYPDTVPVMRIDDGGKRIYSELLTKGESRWVMREIVFRDSTLNFSDKLRIYENDSTEMRRDDRLMWTHYPDRGEGEIIYRHYDYNGRIRREVFAVDTCRKGMHFVDYPRFSAKEAIHTGYLIDSDSVSGILQPEHYQGSHTGVLKAERDGKLISEAYLVWPSYQDMVQGRGDDRLGKIEYDGDGNVKLVEKYTDQGTYCWRYYPGGQLAGHWINKGIHGGIFTTYSVGYHPEGYKTEETHYEHMFPEWGTGYNDTFIINTSREFYPSGRLKSLEKTKSFCESEIYRCGTWTYYNESGAVTRSRRYGDCYNFELEEKYLDSGFGEE